MTLAVGGFHRSGENAKQNDKTKRCRSRHRASVGQPEYDTFSVICVYNNNNNNNNNKITLFQEDNIFGRVASLTYVPQLTNVGMIL